LITADTVPDMNQARLTAAVPFLLLVLAGCGADPTPAAAPAPATTSAAPTVPVDGGTYDSPLVLIDALAKQGISCATYSAVAQPTGAVARGSCYVGAEEYTVGIYASAADARAQPDTMVELLKGTADVNLVLGRNWTLGCPDEKSARSVAAVLGGEVFHQPA
jgi:hypothetical protein